AEDPILVLADEPPESGRVPFPGVVHHAGIWFGKPHRPDLYTFLGGSGFQKNPIRLSPAL
ncbi:MAG: hypothetical protein ACYTHN_04405, partial [Planctomycetota bacterium]